MDKLWAPWRMKYLRNTKQKGCIFCRAKRSKGSDYVILKSRYSIAMLNIYPYNNGHIMVSPLRHIKDFALLKKVETLDLFSMMKKVKAMQEKVLKPDGYNIGMNVSKSAGAGIAGHMHIHIVPRWVGDTNFMPVLNNTKIVSQSLDELQKQLKKC